MILKEKKKDMYLHLKNSYSTICLEVKVINSEPKPRAIVSLTGAKITHECVF